MARETKPENTVETQEPRDGGAVLEPPAPRGHFHSLEGLTRNEQIAANTREFTGDGTPYLKVPGCIGLESVRIGAVVIPPVEIRDYPVDPTLTRFQATPEPMISLESLADGTPVLMRSVLSNDGIWQKGVKIYITGR